MEGKRYHEIFFVHQAEFKDEKDKKIVDTIKNIEGKDYLKYEWIDLDEKDRCPLLPKVLEEILRKKEFPMHRINDELEQNVQRKNRQLIIIICELPYSGNGVW